MKQVEDFTRVLCDKKVLTKLKVLLYKTSIKPTLIYMVMKPGGHTENGR